MSETNKKSVFMNSVPTEECSVGYGLGTPRVLSHEKIQSVLKRCDEENVSVSIALNCVIQVDPSGERIYGSWLEFRVKDLLSLPDITNLVNKLI